MKSISQRLKRALLKLDQFGEPVKLKVDGEESHKSCCGFLLSLVIFVLVLPYSLAQYNTLINYGDTKYQWATIPWGKQDTDITKIPGLTIAIQIMNLRTY